MKNVVSVTNQKGGVGKTTITFNLAHYLAKKGKNILVIDNDPQGNLTRSFFPEGLDGVDMPFVLSWYNGQKNIQPLHINKKLSLVGSDIRLSVAMDKGFDIAWALKEGVDALKADYDIVLIDCLPSFGTLHLASLIAADFALIPIDPSPYAATGLTDLLETVEKAKNRLRVDVGLLGVVVNLMEPRKNIKIETAIQTALREAYDELIFKSELSRLVKFRETTGYGQPIFEHEPGGKADKEFNEFTNEFLRRLKERI